MKSTRFTNLWQFCFTAVLIASFFLIHPPNNKIIAGDGLGYYSYLPAKFIYHDTVLNFKWFDKAFYDNYGTGASSNPTNNFLIPYKDKRIDLYYPCLSFFQLPFFFLSHAAAKLFHYPADGYSSPYQIGMGLSAIFYTLVGLWFCSRLLLKLSDNKLLSLLIPTLVFFGTNLFTCSLYIGGYTHCYSFCFNAIGFYAAWNFFNKNNNKGFYFMIIAFCSLVIFFLRPMNVLLLPGFLYFYTSTFWKQLNENREEKKIGLAALVAIFVLLIFYNLSITYTQTHTFFVNTYAGFKFYFDRWDHVWANFTSFQNGILWYTPLVLLCFIPIFILKKQPKILWLFLPVIGIILLCSFWWYWQVINRTLVDLSVIFMILLLHVFIRFKISTGSGKIVLTIALICLSVFQLKAYQLRSGILNGFNTYGDYYLNYFFRVRPAAVYPIDPKTIIERKGYAYDFESGNQNYITKKNKYRGKRSVTLNKTIDFAFANSFALPFAKERLKKIRLSFWYYRTEMLTDLRLVVLYNRRDSVIKQEEFYMHKKNTIANTWDYMEFGDWYPDDAKEGDVFSMYFWNPASADEVFIDDLKLEFVATNGSDEMLN